MMIPRTITPITDSQPILLSQYYGFNPLTAGAAYIRVYIFISTLNTTF